MYVIYVPALHLLCDCCPCAQAQYVDGTSGTGAPRSSDAAAAAAASKPPSSSAAARLSAQAWMVGAAAAGLAVALWL